MSARLDFRTAWVAFAAAAAFPIVAGVAFPACSDAGSKGARAASPTGGAGGSGGGAAGGVHAPTGGSVGSGASGGLAGAAGAAGGSQGGQETGFLSWTYNGEPIGMYVPEAPGPLPVVLFLHPCHTPPVYAGHWIIAALNAIEPVAVLLPSRPESESAQCAAWGGTYDSAMRPGLADAIAELDRVVDERGFDATRQYVYGESMGGEGAFRLLVDLPTRFAGAVIVGGYTVDTGASAMAETPLHIVHGGADNINPVAAVQTIYQSILDAGGTRVEYTEYAGLDHVPAIERARGEAALLEWLLAQRRD